LQRELRPVLERCRKLVRHYSGSADHFQQLEADAQEARVPIRAFATETVTRWNSTLELLTRELFNDRALAISAIKRGERAGIDRLAAATKRVQLHLCVALHPLRMATKMLEGDAERARASLYLPILARLHGALTAGGELPMPAELREQFPEPVTATSLAPLARDCRKWLAKDLLRVKSKHLAGTDGLRLLMAAAFLDPRFKDAPRQAGQPGPAWATGNMLADARAAVKDLALRSAEQFPALVERWKAASQHPDNRPLAELALVPAGPAPAQRQARKRRRVVLEPPEEVVAVQAVAAAAAAAPPKRALRPHASAEDFLFGRSGAAGSAEPPRPAVVALELEVEAQLARFHALPPVESLSAGPLSWWKTHSWQFPLLATVAMHVHGMPPSTAALERLFSAAGRAITRRRPRLLGTTGAKLIFGHANVRRGHTGSSKRARPSD
jgi:hypothetical protein